MMATKVMGDRIRCLNWLGTFLGAAPKREIKHATDESQAVVADVTEGLTERATSADGLRVAAEISTEASVMTPAATRSGKAKLDEELSPSYLLDSSAPA